MATQCCSYELKARLDRARAGELHLTHGVLPTPAFMPVGTYGAVRGVSSPELHATGARMILANTFHLWERPGPERIADMGGLHKLMAWYGPILTDSGGFQIFSLRDRLKVREEGVTFSSPRDGSRLELTPEKAVALQEAYGVDVAMAFDECLEQPADRARTIESTARTTRWLHRCLAARKHADRTALFGIVQGGTFEDLRAAHARELASLSLDGYALGGLSVGESMTSTLRMVEAATSELPQDKVRYLMGVGRPIDLAQAVIRGVDLFDCVLPTRLGRHANVYTWQGRLNLRNAKFRDDDAPLDRATAGSPAASMPRSMLHHLVRIDEALGRRLLSLHNLALYQQLLCGMRSAIVAGDAGALAAWLLRAHQATHPPETPVAEQDLVE